MGFKNEDRCQFKKIGDDIKHWCLENEGICFKLDGWFNRIMENGFTLLSNFIENVHLFKANDICYTDEQMIEEYATMYGNWCKNVVIIHGMQPLTWNDGLVQEHVNQHEFHEEKKAYKHAHRSDAHVMWDMFKMALK